jgi:hypothetical protein
LDAEVETPNTGLQLDDAKIYFSLNASKLIDGGGLDDGDDDPGSLSSQLSTGGDPSCSPSSITSQRPYPPTNASKDDLFHHSRPGFTTHPTAGFSNLATIDLASMTGDLLLQQILETQKDMNVHIHTLEAENRSLCKELQEAKNLAQ